MLRLLLARLRQGRRTLTFPPVSPALPGRFRGRPILDSRHCEGVAPPCGAERTAGALQHERARSPVVDLGRSLFCPEEAAACPRVALRFGPDYAMATRTREALCSETGEVSLATALDERSRRLFGRSLRLRSVAAGSCNGCEAELVALGNVVFDLARFGVQFVASPRHADGLVITGAVSRNMLLALEKTYAAVPDPKLVIAVGSCAISGGPFRGSPEVFDGVPPQIPVDLWIPGCPPHPLTIMDGLLRLLGRLAPGARRVRAADEPGEISAAPPSRV